MPVRDDEGYATCPNCGCKHAGPEQTCRSCRKAGA